MLDELLAAPHDLPGWFGKLPGMGDFAHRRLPEAFREAWDQWLQQGLMQMRLRHEDWATHYLEGPVWLFALAPHLAGPSGWVGVMMPSVDGVGRYFPLAVAAELRTGADALGPQALSALAPWWLAAARAALEGLEQDLDAGRFDMALARGFAHLDEEAPAVSFEGPGPGQSLWQTRLDDGGARLLCAGLPREARFDRLFGIPGSGDGPGWEGGA